MPHVWVAANSEDLHKDSSSERYSVCVQLFFNVFSVDPGFVVPGRMLDVDDTTIGDSRHDVRKNLSLEI